MNFIKRRITANIERSLNIDRVTAIMGPRQAGKTTLVRYLLKPEREMQYYNLKDPDTRLGLKKNARKEFEYYSDKLIILDEVQTVPNLLELIQLQVDQRPDRKGQFLLLGSNHLLLNRRIRESLAGRVAFFTLLPLSLGEMLENESLSFFERIILSDSLEQAISLIDNIYVPLEQQITAREKFMELCRFGGYPEFIMRKEPEDRISWLRNYHQTYLETDLRQLVELRNTESFEIFENLFAIRVGSLMNISELARDCGLSADTIRRFISYYKQLFVAWQAKPWFANMGKRMMKMSKYYYFDTGVLRSVLGDFSSESGAFFENSVLSEMKKLLSFSAHDPDLFFCRTATGVEADAFIKSRNGGPSLFFEVKQSDKPHAKDVRHLKKYVSNDENAIGILINTGDSVEQMDERIWAVPAAWMFAMAG